MKIYFNIQISKNKSCPKKGTTARVLDTMKENIDKISKEIHEESKNRNAVQQQILEEQQNLRKIYEDFAGKTYEQSIKANMLREDRNNILKEYLQKSKKSD